MSELLVSELGALLDAGLTHEPHPLFPGAVCAVDDGHQTRLIARGFAYRYADASGAKVADREQRAMSVETLFDLASVTKLFTATVIMHLVERGLLGLDEPLAHHLSSYTAGERAQVTVRHLLTHTSGLPDEIHFWRDFPDAVSRREAVLVQPLVASPGSRSQYSCVGYITLGLLAERLLDLPLEVAVDQLVCAPLGLDDTGYLPLTRPSSSPVGENLRDRVAATEMRRIDWTALHEPADPDPRGVVHDENAAALGGVSGNAGLFAPARDLLSFGRALLQALHSGEPTRLGLTRTSVREMVSPQLPAGVPSDYQSGLGWRIDDPSFMTGLLGSGHTYGHPGFTGTSLLVDEDRDLVCVLLTNRVHPTRDWSVLVPFRQRLAALLASHYPGPCPPGRRADR